MKEITDETKLTQQATQFTDSGDGCSQECALYVDGVETNITSLVAGNNKTKYYKRVFVVNGSQYKTPKEAFEADGYKWAKNV